MRKSEVKERVRRLSVSQQAMIRVHKVGRAFSRNKEGMSLRFEMTNLRWKMQRREESGRGD